MPVSLLHGDSWRRWQYLPGLHGPSLQHNWVGQGLQDHLLHCPDRFGHLPPSGQGPLQRTARELHSTEHQSEGPGQALCSPVTISHTHAKLFFHPRLTSVLQALFYNEDAMALKRLNISQPDWEPRALLTKSAGSKHLRPLALGLRLRKEGKNGL